MPKYLVFVEKYISDFLPKYVVFVQKKYLIYQSWPVLTGMHSYPLSAMLYTEQYCSVVTTLLRAQQHCFKLQHTAIMSKTVPYGTTLFHTAQHCFILQNTVQNYKTLLLLRNTVPYFTTLFWTAYNCSIHHKVVPYCTTLFHTAQHCSILYNTVPYYTTLSLLHKNISKPAKHILQDNPEPYCKKLHPTEQPCTVMHIPTETTSLCCDLNDSEKFVYDNT